MSGAVAFVGLGVMGYPMAGHLARKGREVAVYNRTSAKAEAWVAEYGGRVAKSPAEAAAGKSIVFACVGDDPDVEAVVLGRDGAFSGMDEGSIFVDHTTASPSLARRLAELGKERGIAFLDAPVSGGQAGAEKGALTVMVGGPEEAFERARPSIEAYARQLKRVGPSGSGQLTKMVNQICIAGILQGLAEGLLFARSAGLDLAAVVDVISKGAAQSWQMENRHQTMSAGQYDFGFAVDWMRKDLRIALGEAAERGIELPLTELVDGFYADVQAMGGSRWDSSSLLARLVKRAEATPAR